MTTEYFKETFRLSGSPASVKLSNIRGHVEVSTWDKDKVEVKATIHLDSGDEELTKVRVYQEENGRVVAKVEFKKTHGWLRICRPCKVEFEVKVPVNCDLKVNTVSSSANLTGIIGNIKIAAVSGRTEVSDLSGTLNLNSVSGKLVGENLNGDLYLDSVSGSVRLKDCDFSSIRANTVSGGLHIHTPLNHEGHYKFSSVSGEVSLHLPDNTPCTAKISSLSGRIRSVHSATSKSGSRRNQVIDFHGGGVLVKMSSVSGGLSLHSNGGNGLQTPVVKRKTKEERLEVLSRLQGGELSVREAMAALE